MFESDGDVGLRLMRDEAADYSTLTGWLSDPRVLEWVFGRDDPFDAARVAAKYGPRVRGEDPVTAAFIVAGGHDVGYVQFYPVLHPEDYGLDEAPGTWAADIFVGEHELWGTGLGTSAMRLLLGHVFGQRLAERMVIDPRVDNPRAVRSYEKAGFRKLKELPAHEFHEGRWWDSWLLELTRADWQATHVHAGR